MTKDEYRQACQQLGFGTSDEVGAFFGCHPVTVRRWASGGLPIPPAVEKLLRLMINAGVSPQEVDAIVEQQHG